MHSYYWYVLCALAHEDIYARPHINACTRGDVRAVTKISRERIHITRAPHTRQCITRAAYTPMYHARRIHANVSRAPHTRQCITRTRAAYTPMYHARRIHANVSRAPHTRQCITRAAYTRMYHACRIDAKSVSWNVPSSVI